VPGAQIATEPVGRPLPAAASYDAATRTVTVRLPTAPTGTVLLTVTTGLPDIQGRHLAATSTPSFELG
ncbi:MAG: hypothetical protein M3024_07110, partial [Candidatus Dormibacteraeota bacterium]|nr:hypothetical protein [Candidatus Dormibacteraeota bacterium]